MFSRNTAIVFSSLLPPGPWSVISIFGLFGARAFEDNDTQKTTTTFGIQNVDAYQHRMAFLLLFQVIFVLDATIIFFVNQTKKKASSDRTLLKRPTQNTLSYYCCYLNVTAVC